MATTLSRRQPQSTYASVPELANRLFNESFVLPSFFDRSLAGGSSPASLPVNLMETVDSYVMQAALPGLNTESLDIQVTGREVSIRGQFKLWQPEKANWLWNGIPAGEFYETYSLPADVEGGKVEATYEHGILTLSLPKAEHLRPKQIKVSVK